ncbi:transcription factor IIS [Artemisia annua]|uniref:Transcription factor IIS n=1 Tax=Artemisia annua TaxID=35608 RepID=A0A2U1KU25_ARTAN|nr:transcription factor IIS [Artemisia annua]
MLMILECCLFHSIWKVDHQRYLGSGTGLTVQGLVSHSILVVQEIAKTLYDMWSLIKGIDGTPTDVNADATSPNGNNNNEKSEQLVKSERKKKLKCSKVFCYLKFSKFDQENGNFAVLTFTWDDSKLSQLDKEARKLDIDPHISEGINLLVKRRSLQVAATPLYPLESIHPAVP